MANKDVVFVKEIKTITVIDVCSQTPPPPSSDSHLPSVIDICSQSQPPPKYHQFKMLNWYLSKLPKNKNVGCRKKTKNRKKINNAKKWYLT